MSYKKVEIEKKLEAIDEIVRGSDIVSTSRKHGIHPKTLRKWVKLHKEGGLKKLAFPQISSSKQKLEEQVALMKERNPQLTIEDARKKLAKKGVLFSNKKIWSIWQKYGLCGFDKKRMYLNIISPVPPNQEVIEKLYLIEYLVKVGRLEEAIELTNSLPYFPLFERLKEVSLSYQLLHKLPFSKLNVKRQLEWLLPKFGEISYVEYGKIAHRLRKELKNRELNHSSILAGVLEVISLGWTGEIRRQLILIDELLSELGRMNAPHIRFILLLSKGMALARRLELKGASKCLRRLKKLVNFLPEEFRGDLLPLLVLMWRYREARELGESCLDLPLSKGRKEMIKVYLSCIYAVNAEYKRALQILRKIALNYRGVKSRIYLIRAEISLCRGNVEMCMNYALKSIQFAKKEHIFGQLNRGTFLLSCAHRALNFKNEAEKHLKAMIPILKKSGNYKELMLRQFLLGEKIAKETVSMHPGLRLANYLKRASEENCFVFLEKAKKFAEKEKLWGLFMQLALFFPDAINNCLKLGRPIKIPPCYFNLPLYHSSAPVFKLDFLGHLRIWRGNKRIKMNLLPKEQSFLIFIATFPSKTIPIEKIYKNYWYKSRNPSINLSRTLSKLRKTLSIPREFLKRKGNLLQVKVFFSTDYQIFKEHMTKGKAFERLGDVNSALREYKRALSLVRGDPFKKCYDNFAEDFRTKIIWEIEEVKERCRNLTF
jgi:transposase-like protein